jgi:hypothetical protein
MKLCYSCRFFHVAAATLALVAAGCASERTFRAFDPATAVQVEPSRLVLPLSEGSVRFAVIGDAGTGDSEQYEVGRMLTSYWEVFPFEFAIMMGDNLYGGEDADDYLEKFERPYQALLKNEVKFYAALARPTGLCEKSWSPSSLNTA